MAGVIPWTSQDDFLLKNSIEDGASLESLAKGAVQFSRRFTITELQDRWYSLLYDVNTSIDASVRMTEFERSTSKRMPKLKRTDQPKSKDDNCRSGKRKADSIRKCYYALRKKMRKPLNPDNFNFLGDSHIASGIETPGVSNMVEGKIVNDLELQDDIFDDLDVIPQAVRDNAMLCDVNEFLHEHPNTLEDSIEQNSAQNEIFLGSSMAMPGTTAVTTQVSNGDYIFQSAVATQVSNGETNLPPGFRGDNFAPFADGGTTFHPVHYESTSPAVLHLKEIEGGSVQELADDANITGISEYNVLNTEHNHRSRSEMKNSTELTEDYFMDYDDSLFDFTNEEELRDTIEQLLNSPYDANDGMPNIPVIDPAVLVALPDTVSIDPEDTVVGDIHSSMGACILENQVPTSLSTVSPEFPNYFGGGVFCLLNIEDPEVPRNDHIIFPGEPRATLANGRIQRESNPAVLSSKDDYAKQVSEVGTMEPGPQQFGNSNLASQMRDPEIQLNHEVDEFVNNAMLCDVNEFLHEHPNTLQDSIEQNSVQNERPCCSSGLAIEKEYSELSPVQQSDHCVIDKSHRVSDSGLALSVADGINQEGQPMASAGDQACCTAHLMNTEPGGEPMLSYGSEEQYSDSDTDMPSFSEVEAMILDMDLEPGVDDSFGCWEVHLDEVLMRKIIRLEQIAHSDMQRDMAKHRAIAILYNLHSKYYIKKSEVSLGRGSGGILVDIDLEREGCVSSISRQQAIIKIDKDGTFYMKNLGKRKIYVDDVEKKKDETVSLRSNCLIQIRGIWFIFDYLRDSRLVKQFLSNNG